MREFAADRAVAGRAAPLRLGLRRLWLVLDNLEELIGGAALLIVVASVSWGVLSRYVSRQPAPWAGELAILAFAWLIFFGAAACFKYGLHPSIDMDVKRLPPTLRRLAVLFAEACVIGFCLLMIWLGVVFSAEAWTDPTPVLRLPMTVVYGPVTLGFALMLVRHLQYLWRKAKGRPVPTLGSELP